MKMLAGLLLLNLALVTASDVKKFYNSNRKFSANVYKAMVGSTEGNFLVCPMSAEIVLSMVHAGAKKETATQLAHGLSLPDSKNEISSMMYEILPHLQSAPPRYTLKTVNKMYIAKNLSIKKDFKSTVVDVFKASVENADFSKPDKVVKDVNNWVAKKTNNHIKELLALTDFDASTKAILLNTMYLQAYWATSFTESSTKKANFFTGKDRDVEVDMMEETDLYGYYKSDHLKAKMLKMRYSEMELSMVVVLPNDKNGITDLEAKIDQVLDLHKFEYKHVHVKFPKFKMDATVKFVPILEKMGVIDLFTPSSDLTGITSDGSLHITNIIQKNYIEVNEKGTIAASATAAAIPISDFHVPNPPNQFFADHPFIYYIESQAGVLFIGRYAGH